MTYEDKSTLIARINGVHPNASIRSMLPENVRGTLLAMVNSMQLQGEDSVTVNITNANELGKTYAAFGDGESHIASDYYDDLAALQADYDVATSEDYLDYEMDGIVIEQCIADELTFFSPMGEYLINHAISQSGKDYRWHGDGTGRTIITCNAVTRIPTLFNVASSTQFMKGITFDGGMIVNVIFRRDTGYFTGLDIEAKNFGNNSSNMGTTGVIGFMFDDPHNVYIDGITGSNIHSRQTGQITGDNGLARLLQIGNGTVGSTHGTSMVRNFFMDCTGSQAPQLDPIAVSIDSLTHITIDSPVVLYNQYTRRCIKIQGTHCDVIAPTLRPCDTFTADGAGTTDVGSYCLNCVDATATTGLEGSITVHGGYIDASGFVVALGRTSGTASFKAIGCNVYGSTKRCRKLINIEGQVKTGDATAISGGNTLTLTAHAFSTGVGCSVAADVGGTLPTGLSAGVLYYTRAATADTITFHATSSDASGNLNPIALTAGTGTFTLYTGQDTDHVGFYTDTQSGYGSGVENCNFKYFTMGFYIRAQYSYVKNCRFYDPQEYGGYINNSSSAAGFNVSGNDFITVTSGALNNTQVIRVFRVTDTIIRNNRLIQAGNTTHANRFIGSTDANSTGVAMNNIAPTGCTAFYHTTGTWSNVGNRPTKAGFLVQTTAAANVGTGEDNLQQVVLDPSPFEGVGSGIRFRAHGRFANNANAKTVKFYFGSATICTLTLPTSVAGNWIIDVAVANTGTNAQDVEYVAHYTNSGGSVMDTIAGRTTTTQTETSQITVKCTGEGTSNGDITQEMLVPQRIYS